MRARTHTYTLYVCVVCMYKCVWSNRIGDEGLTRLSNVCVYMCINVIKLVVKLVVKSNRIGDEGLTGACLMYVFICV